MYKLEVMNELYLKATCLDGAGELYTKAGAWVGGYGGYKFTKVLLGPSGNPLKNIVGQVGRRMTGENLPLMKVATKGQSETYYADLSQHVTVINLPVGVTIKVESENILAFTGCKYGVTFIGTGVISQKGLFTSTLTGEQPGAAVAILTDGNPLIMDTPCKVDPDAHIAHTGANPGIAFDIGWRNLIGQASGETYMFEFKQPGGKVIIQPTERTSGIDIGIDGQGGKPAMQDNRLFREDGNQMFKSGSQMVDAGDTYGGQSNDGGVLAGVIGQILK